MSFSMTGYGQSSVQFGGYKIMFEVKSVNHRYCEAVFRMPREWGVYEETLRHTVQERIKRGRIDISIHRTPDGEQPYGASLNPAAVSSYLRAADTLKSEFGLEGSLSLRDLLSLPGVMTGGEAEPSLLEEEEGQLQAALVSGLAASLDGLLEMRAREGRHLAADLKQRTARLRELHKQMTVLAPTVTEEYAVKLKLRIRELLGDAQPLDEYRLGTEIALFADRCSIDEELIRLESHLDQFDALLSGHEPVGRKLDFLIQEMNRETNTIGTKSNHLTLVNRVVDMKAELEKIREQAANLE